MDSFTDVFSCSNPRYMNERASTSGLIEVVETRAKGDDVLRDAVLYGGRSNKQTRMVEFADSLAGKSMEPAEVRFETEEWINRMRREAEVIAKGCSRAGSGLCAMLATETAHCQSRNDLIEKNSVGVQLFDFLQEKFACQRTEIVPELGKRLNDYDVLVEQFRMERSDHKRKLEVLERYAVAKEDEIRCLQMKLKEAQERIEIAEKQVEEQEIVTAEEDMAALNVGHDQLMERKQAICASRQEVPVDCNQASVGKQTVVNDVLSMQLQLLKTQSLPELSEISEANLEGLEKFIVNFKTRYPVMVYSLDERKLVLEDKLKGDAFKHYSALPQAVKNNELNIIFDALRARFGRDSTAISIKAMQQLKRLEMDDQGVLSFCLELDRLFELAHPKARDTEMISWEKATKLYDQILFWKGSYNLRKVLDESSRNDAYENLKEAALRLEAMHLEERESGNDFGRQYGSMVMPTSEPLSPNSSPLEQPSTSTVQSMVISASDSQHNTVRKSGNRKCYGCGDVDHFIRRCPMRSAFVSAKPRRFMGANSNRIKEITEERSVGTVRAKLSSWKVQHKDLDIAQITVKDTVRKGARKCDKESVASTFVNSWRELLRNDLTFRTLVTELETGKRYSSDQSAEDKNSKARFLMKEGYLCLLSKRGDYRKVVPGELRKALFWESHCAQFGHIGVRNVLRRLEPEYFWPKMAKDIRTWSKECTNCCKVRHIGDNKVSLIHAQPRREHGNLLMRNLTEFNSAENVLNQSVFVADRKMNAKSVSKKLAERREKKKKRRVRDDLELPVELNGNRGMSRMVQLLNGQVSGGDHGCKDVSCLVGNPRMKQVLDSASTDVTFRDGTMGTPGHVRVGVRRCRRARWVNGSRRVD